MRIFFAFSILLFALLASPLFARDFTAEDFDPSDFNQFETYFLASESLINDLTVVALDNDDREIFSIVPMTMELVALMTQTQIHQSYPMDDTTMAHILGQANSDKPTANSFAFIIDGDASWVNKDLSIYYYTVSDTPERLEMPVVEVEDKQVVDGLEMLRGWAIMAESVEQLQAFLDSPRVELVIGENDSTTGPITLDVSFWRQYGLFDLRGEEE